MYLENVNCWPPTVSVPCIVQLCDKYLSWICRLKTDQISLFSWCLLHRSPRILRSIGVPVSHLFYMVLWKFIYSGIIKLFSILNSILRFWDIEFKMKNNLFYMNVNKQSNSCQTIQVSKCKHALYSADSARELGLSDFWPITASLY
jgi:hypothetical protein